MSTKVAQFVLNEFINATSYFYRDLEDEHRVLSISKNVKNFRIGPSGSLLLHCCEQQVGSEYLIMCDIKIANERGKMSSLHSTVTLQFFSAMFAMCSFNSG